MNKWVGAGLVGVGAMALGGPYLSGTEAETQYHQAIKSLNKQAGITAVSESYDKGYLSADVLTIITIDRTELDEELPQEITLSTHISHGIYSVNAVTHLLLGDTATTEFKEILGDKPPIEIITKINVLGDASIVATTPKIDFTKADSDETVSISVFEMTLDVPSDYKQVKANVSWPGMSVSGSDGAALVVGPFSMQQTGSQLTDYLWTSDMSMTLDSISGTDDGQTFDLKQLKLSSLTEEASEGRINSSFEMAVDSVKLNDDEFRNQKLVFTLSDLAVKEFDALMETFDKLEETAQIGDPQQQAMAQMEQFSRIGQDVTALFNKGLKIDISELFVNTPKGDVNGMLHLEQPESDVVNNAGPGALLQTTKGNLLLTVPVLLLEGGTPEMQQQLDALLAQNFIVKEGDVYKTEAILENMIINVNGTELPLPPLM